MEQGGKIDNDVEVEVEDDSSYEAPPLQDPTLLDNVTPSIVTNSVNLVVSFIATYGWFILAAAVLVYYIYNKYKPQYQQWKEDADRKKELNSFDPDAVQARHEAVEKSRRRLQQKYDAEVAQHKEKMKEKEEEDRQRKIQDWEDHKQGKGYRSKVVKTEDEWVAANATNARKPAAKKPKLRQSEHNPLMGDTSGPSCSWRPGRRSGGG